MFDLAIKMDTNAIVTREAFGISKERKAEIYKKLVAVASIFPKYSIIVETFLNCTDRFTEMERLYGLFELGRVSGKASIMRQAKVLIKYDSVTMPIEGKLLSLMSKQVQVIDPLLGRILEEGKDGR